MADKFRYSILYVQDTGVHRVMDIIKEHVPRERVEVFYPCMEYYRRDIKAVKIKAIFPSYLFLYTDMNIKEVHEILREYRAEFNTAFRELSLSEKRVSDSDFLFRDDSDDGLLELSDVSEGEKEYLDYLRKGDGLLKMSSGYEYNDKNGNKRYVVMEGPLKPYEDKITKVDKHNRRAYLRFSINNEQAQAGFSCLPRTHWYPEADTRIVKLSDNSEVDLGKLQKSIMGIK